MTKTQDANPKTFYALACPYGDEITATHTENCFEEAEGVVALDADDVAALRDAVRAVTSNLDSGHACRVNAILQSIIRRADEVSS